MISVAQVMQGDIALTGGEKNERQNAVKIE
jgi:hypothetical protein